MWVLVALPPLLARWSVQRPERCPRCGNLGGMIVHQRLRRPLREIQPDAGIVSEAQTLRWRCKNCGTTVTDPGIGKAQGFRVQKHLQAEIVLRFALGDPPSKVLSMLSAGGVAISRSTVHRIIQGADDGYLRSFHLVNRERYRLAGKRGRPFYWYWIQEGPSPYGSFGQLVSEPVLVVEDSPAVAVVRQRVFLFFLYGDTIGRGTVGWLENYFESIDCGGLTTFERLEDVAAAFGRDGPLREQLDYETLLLTEESEAGATNWELELNRRSTRSLIRVAEIESRQKRTMERPVVGWQNRNAWFRLDNIPGEDIFDETKISERMAKERSGRG